MHGVNARLLSKDGAWDLLPHAGGATLALGPGASKVSYDFSGKTREKLGDHWRFTAVVVGSESVRAYVGGLGQPLAMIAEKPRREHNAAARGELVLGTLGGIRPFNGWLDGVRIFGTAHRRAGGARHLRRRCGEREADRRAAGVRPRASAGPDASVPLEAFGYPVLDTLAKNKQAPAIMESFHTTQCLWVYGTQAEFIQQIKGLGIGYQGTLNGLQGQEHATAEKSAARRHVGPA